MKLRFDNDSLRLRLDRDEVDALGRGETATSVAHFPDGRELHWRLEAQGDEVSATFTDGLIRVCMPAATAEHWANDDREVSVCGPSPASPGTLYILIEKDFECLEPRTGESQRNRFTNPKKQA